MKTYNQGAHLPPARADEIERIARETADAGRTLGDACPYPWRTPAAEHFTAHFFLAGGLMDECDEHDAGEQP